MSRIVVVLAVLPAFCPTNLGNQNGEFSIRMRVNIRTQARAQFHKSAVQQVLNILSRSLNCIIEVVLPNCHATSRVPTGAVVS